MITIKTQDETIHISREELIAAVCSWGIFFSLGLLIGILI